MNIKFGRLPSAPDVRDYDLGEYIPKFRLTAASIVQDRVWDFAGAALNQDDTGHCTGFASAAFMRCAPVCDVVSNADGHAIYYRIKALDGEPRMEDGATIRMAAKALVSMGRIKTYAFAYTPADIKWWLLNKGPVIAGTAWTDFMMLPNAVTGEVIPTGKVVGGHAYLMRGYSGGKYICQNSWGKWGLRGSGMFTLSENSLVTLMRAGAEFMTGAELPINRGGR